MTLAFAPYKYNTYLTTDRVSLYKAFLLIDRELSGCPQWEVLQLLMGLATGGSTSIKRDICLDKILSAHNPKPDGSDI